MSFDDFLSFLKIVKVEKVFKGGLEDFSEIF